MLTNSTESIVVHFRNIAVSLKNLNEGERRTRTADFRAITVCLNHVNDEVEEEKHERRTEPAT